MIALSVLQASNERLANRRAYHKAWRLKNKEKMKERYQLNKELIKELSKEKSREYYLLNKEKIDKNAKESRSARKYRARKKSIDPSFFATDEGFLL